MRIVACPQLGGKYSQKLIASAAAAARMAARTDCYDIVHQHSIAAGAFNWMAGLRNGHQSLLQMHGLEWRRTKWGFVARRLIRALEFSAIHQFRHWTAVSKIQCQNLKARYGIPVRYIPTASEVLPAVPGEIIQRKYGLTSGAYVLFLARLVPEKGAHLLIEAYRRLKTDQRLVIAGDAPAEARYINHLKRLAKDDPRILFTGRVQDRTLHELFSNCSIYVQPSIIEGLSIALLEAMSFGCCCLVSDIPENCEAIGGNGFTFKSSDVDSLKSQLRRALGERQLSEELGCGARERVRTCYSWELVTDQMEELYSSICRPGQTSARRARDFAAIRYS
jgi:glycosyltransferase involved in cell wall biosynthesis